MLRLRFYSLIAFIGLTQPHQLLAVDLGVTPCGLQVAAHAQGDQSHVRTVADLTAQSVRYIGEDFSTLRLVEYPWLGTKAVIHKKGIVTPDSKAIVVLWHGWGGQKRGMGSNLNALRVLAAEKEESKFVAKVRRQANVHDENYLDLGAITYDFVGHGHSELFGSSLPHGEDALDVLCDVFAQDLLRLKAKYGKKIILLGRSAGPSFAKEVIARHPDVIDALVGISVSHARPDIDHHVVEALRERIESGALESSWDLFNWLNHLYSLKRWHLAEDPTHGVPTLLMSGTKDEQNPSSARQDYDRLAEIYPHIRHVTYTGAGHDPLSTGKSNRETMNAAFRDIFSFIRSVTNDEG